MFLKNKNIIFKIRRSKVTDYAALKINSILKFQLYVQGITVKTVLSGHLKRRPKLGFKTHYGLMQVKSIAECSKRAFCNTFDLH